MIQIQVCRDDELKEYADYMQTQSITAGSFCMIMNRERRITTMTYDENEKQNLIRVVVCRPGERAEATWIEENLRSMQAAVGGLIQEFKPFHSESDPRYDSVALICNEEGKLMNLEPSRLIKDENGSGRYDAIAGPFFICYAPVESETFMSLPEDLEEEFRKRYELPEMFYRTGTDLISVKYEPEPRAKGGDVCR